jgi:formate dehydrogenase maturation protein FdhE
MNDLNDFNDIAPQHSPSMLEQTGPAPERCPRCGEPNGSLSLLTSMMRYYLCERCECRWHVSRREENLRSLTRL